MHAEHTSPCRPGIAVDLKGSQGRDVQLRMVEPRFDAAMLAGPGITPEGSQLDALLRSGFSEAEIVTLVSSGVTRQTRSATAGKP
ncbi:hypothetical protein J2W56_001050 [Nocardia kruczakiae]|uniref:Uncharacterized protein n=1 Tax=Nocardia kruczakiae TaxID=261477 RepID=A0ABU1X9W4_9NOCA|nr:hypothetical protein [Nocardia kruczakiae]MDR7167332.1 hypothetical protein [Nocardia kruczakiae]